MKSIFPNPLIKGQTIGLICPAGGFKNLHHLQKVEKYFLSLGFKVRLGKSLIVKKKYFQYLSGTDEERLNDFNYFLDDDEVSSIFCLRGGYGSSRLLNEINFKKIEKGKKIILGYSDITALLLAIYAKTGLVTFHGPMFGKSFFTRGVSPKIKSNANYLWKLLRDENFNFSYKASSTVISKGVAFGKLLGGNLTIISSLLGTAYLPDFTNSILFLEDCFEEPYKIDRLITQLDNANIFKKIKGLLFTDFHRCKFKSKKEIILLLKDRLKLYKIPIIYGFPVGHGRFNYALPIGREVVFNANVGLLSSK